MAAKSSLFTPDAAQRIAKAVKRIEGQAPAAPTPEPTGTNLPPMQGSVWLYILSSVRDGTKWRWTYNARPVRKTLPGFESSSAWNWDTRWPSASNQLTKVYNTHEFYNTAATTLGINQGTLGIAGIDPVPSGAIVKAEIVPVWNGTAVENEFWFTFPNAPTINCLEEA
jgi:hypothetical protein